MTDSLERQVASIQNTLLQMSETQGRMEGKLDAAIRDRNRLFAALDVNVVRLNVLEGKVSRITGWAAGIAFAVSATFSLLKAKMFG